MTNTRNTRNARTSKVRKTNRKFIATLCAVLAATAMVTGIAVFTVSASIKENDVKTQPSTATQTVTEKSADSSSKTSTAEKAAMQAMQSLQAKQAVNQQVPTQAQAVNQQAAVQAQAVQQAPVQAQEAQQAPAQVQEVQQAPAQDVQQAAPAAQSSTLYIPDGEVNDWKIHNAKDGFPIGSYFNGKSVLYVNKLDNANYAITVTVPTDDNTATVYNINAVANGSKMYYSYGAKSTVEYDANGNITNAIVLDNNHQGTFDASDAGYTWVDTEGTTVFVPWIGYPVG